MTFSPAAGAAPAPGAPAAGSSNNEPVNPDQHSAPPPTEPCHKKNWSLFEDAAGLAQSIVADGVAAAPGTDHHHEPVDYYQQPSAPSPRAFMHNKLHALTGHQSAPFHHPRLSSLPHYHRVTSTTDRGAQLAGPLQSTTSSRYEDRTGRLLSMRSRREIVAPAWFAELRALQVGRLCVCAWLEQCVWILESFRSGRVVGGSVLWSSSCSCVCLLGWERSYDDAVASAVASCQAQSGMMGGVTTLAPARRLAACKPHTLRCVRPPEIIHACLQTYMQAAQDLLLPPPLSHPPASASASATLQPSIPEGEEGGRDWAAAVDRVALQSESLTVWHTHFLVRYLSFPVLHSLPLVQLQSGHHGITVAMDCLYQQCHCSSHDDARAAWLHVPLSCIYLNSMHLSCVCIP